MLLPEALDRFVCRRCNLCCRQPGYVYLSSAEAGAAAACLGLDPYEFTEKYCEVMDRQRLVLKKLPDESCVFLTAEGCAIHPAKPGQCRDFPVKWRTPRSLDYCEGLKQL
ncbi:MAG: YkgJ family cysteine cluster protein [Candidatus Omnitrophica bacterium]|nr:YkgJ family cysteine cluster protein [Candidatus Omnitrophota bacterium]